MVKMFDTEKFICEIEKWPAIYNVTMKEYSNRDIKAKMWEEVATLMYGNWNELPVEERNKLGRELQTRWKSLRDQFRKEVRATKTAHSGQSAPKKKKQYVYFDQLLFLLPSVAARVTASNLIDDAITNDADAVEENDDIQMTTLEEAPLTASSSSRITPTAETGGTRKRPRNARNVCSDATEIRQMTQVLSDSLSLQRENRQTDTFGNNAFLMSLLPQLDAMSEDNMFDCRMRLMEDVRYYRFLHSNNSVQRSMQNTSTSYMLLPPSSTQPHTPASDVSLESQMTDSSQFDLYQM